jgi:hypothetical protein
MRIMPDPTAGETGWVLSAIVALIGLVGGAIAWAVGRGDRVEDRAERDEKTRTAKLEAWHSELVARERLMAAQRDAFQARIDRHLAEQDVKIADLEDEIEKYRLAVPLLAARVAHYDPEDPALGQVSSLLGVAFPFPNPDAAMTDLLRRMP